MKLSAKDKDFFDRCYISNISGFLAGDWYENGNNEVLVRRAKELALEALNQRKELFSETVKKDYLVPQEIVEVDYEEIIRLFNKVCSMLPTVTKSTIGRERAIDKILETYSLLDIGTVFNNVIESDYLCGKKANWMADFDWVFIPKNFIRIFEGKFKNVVNGSSNTSRTDNEIKQSANDSVDALFGEPERG